MRRQNREIEEKKTIIGQDLKQVSQLESEISTLSSTEINIQQRINSYSGLISQTETIRTGLVQFTKAKNQFEALEAI